jgi:hypothetical protein
LYRSQSELSGRLERVSIINMKADSTFSRDAQQQRRAGWRRQGKGEDDLNMITVIMELELCGGD